MFKRIHPRYVCIATATCLFIFIQQAFAQPNGVTLLGHIDKKHGTIGAQAYSSCWGWVSPDGREYALLGAIQGTSIIDLNGDSLRELQFITGPSSMWREMKTYKHYAYVVSEGGWGVQIIDLSGLPDTAVLVKNFVYAVNQGPDSGKHTQRTHTVTIADGYLYLNGCARWAPGGALIFSLKEDPTTPAFVGMYQPDYFHDTYVRNDTLYGSSIWGAGLFIADVRNKNNPVPIGQIAYSQAGTHNAWASLDGKYVFTTDEINNPNLDMKVWALDSLPNSALVAQYIAEPTSIVHNVHGRGHYLYVSHYTAGMRVVDVHDPRNPIEVGFYDTYPGASGGYNGCWGVYPYFPSGRWIGSDRQTGLYLCDFNGLKPRVRPELLSPGDGDSPKTLVFKWTSAANQSEDPHWYDVHIRGEETSIVLTTNDTVISLSEEGPPLVDGQYSWFVIVRDEYTEVSSLDTFQVNYFPGLKISIDLELGDGWNMVSIPLTMKDYQKTTLFPSAVSNAFTYVGNYVVTHVLENGVGYWLKFDGSETLMMYGEPRTADSIDVVAGWNMIGSISSPLHVSNILSDPGGIVTSSFFGYNGAYYAATEIEPGKAYWVRVTQSGKLIFSPSEAGAQNRITIVPSDDLPPPPPGPEISDVDPVTPSRFHLSQNYPNPFNPITTIEFELAHATDVTLSIVDALGREVAVLLSDAHLPAGRQQVAFDASRLPSGVYFYRIATREFTSLGKMTLAR